MLSTSSADVVRATLPAIGAHIEEITTLFYRNLFADHPELERDLFNRGNQAQGDQQRALAGAIAAFAAVLVADDAPSPERILARIANKHASLGITEDQYQVVHDYLFGAIVAVLGEAVTPAVATAWDEVYWLMANSLIALERELYASAQVAPGDVWRTVTVAAREQLSAQSFSLTLASSDGTALPDFLPGQYISVAVQLPDGARQIRQYSLSGAAGPQRWRITIKRVLADPPPAGEVSNFLYDNVFEGDDLAVSAPFGNLTLPVGDQPLLLVSAGIGCTPMIGMLDHLATVGDARRVSVVHVDRSLAEHAHRSELAELVHKLPAGILRSWYEDLGMRAPTDEIRSGSIDFDGIALTPDVQTYLCGPLQFMRDVRRELIARQVPPSHIHYEVFGSDMWLQAS